MALTPMNKDALHLAASDIHFLYQPAECGLRVRLRHLGEPEAEPGPFEQLIFRLGERHEQAHLASFPEVLDLRQGSREERERQTLEALQGDHPVLYRPVLRAVAALGGVRVEIVGEPDFLIREDPGHLLRDAKLARRIDQEAHPEILLQLQLYGWLYEQVAGRPPVRLEIYSGNGEIVVIPYDGGKRALEVLERILALRLAKEEPYSPVGWSKCGGCGFRRRCWPRAEVLHDVALVVGVDQGLAIALREEGIRSYDDLLREFPEARLSEFKRPWGQRFHRVGKSAAGILRNAKSLASGRELVFCPLRLPHHPNFAMFDLEGLPPHLDDVEKIYLWGMQVFGERPGEFRAATGGFGEEGDREGWEGFLKLARGVFEAYGNIPFVHWASYEKTKIKIYMERFGDWEGVAQQVLHNLLDLLPIVRDSIALPLPSYSLKVVEEYVGFRRSQKENGGDWAIARYIEATETEDAVRRDALMEKILAYNREDLEATWAVLQWLRQK
ncbi:MAG: TM0106 family RecB-like putative nuclease [Candidatus Tectomicrobia bacterium]|uniref:TM0106 family RecB-like putative nuclease n=1 Tax=Tectimicrobiota bacterium TaxID=2528274 RepID=A0A932HXB0_UNCTE|nr:TM0106 family RecB-like putative nuclease [Candidatus Tectomicrobia bacterium]